MKRLTSVLLTAAMCAAMIVPVQAAEKITAEDVKNLFWSTGLSNYPELCERDAIIEDITNRGYEKDVYKLKDLVDINYSRRNFAIAKGEDGVYSLDYSGSPNMQFSAFDKYGYEVTIFVYDDSWDFEGTANQILYRDGNSEYSSGKDDTYLIYPFTYEQVAESINENGIGKVKTIVLAYEVIYVDTENGAYVIPRSDSCDLSAKYLSREEKSYRMGEMMPLNEYMEIWDYINQNLQDDPRKVIYNDELVEDDEIVEHDEHEKGSAVRDTDTRAAYIGTTSKFSDVSGDLVSYVNELSDLGIVDGYDNDMFQPEKTVTRAEAASMIARMLKCSGSYDGRFSDVSAGEWCAGAVAALADRKTINGTSETTFSPDGEIRYIDMLKILVGTLGYSLPTGSTNADYENTVMDYAMKIGLVKNVSSFATDGAVTRGDLAVMLSNALDTHLFTTYVKLSGSSITEIGGGEDITLIDYLNGGKLNGELNAKN